jgi:hypothetical protein
MIRIFAAVALGLLCLSCTSEPASYGGPMWSKSMHMARIFLEDEDVRLSKRLARAERWLDSELYFVPENDARYPTTLLFLGFVERAKGHDTVADSLLKHAVAMADTSLRASRWEMSRFGRWWNCEVRNSRRYDGVYEALIAAKKWSVIWRGMLEPGHPDMAVLTGVMAAMQQFRGHAGAADSLYAESLPILETSGVPYGSCGSMILRIRRDLGG